MKKKHAATPGHGVDEGQALALHQLIGALIREFKLEPGLLAGSVYADLHANDIALFEILGEPGAWNVQAIAQKLGAPITTISSALDRLERSGLIARKRTSTDRRVVHIELTPAGQRLGSRLRDAHVKNCRMMLARLAPPDREVFLRIAGQIAQPKQTESQ